MFRTSAFHIFALLALALLLSAGATSCSAPTSSNLDNYDERRFDREDGARLSIEIVYLHQNRQDIFNKLRDVLFTRTARETRQKRVLRLWDKLRQDARTILANMAIKEQIFQTGPDASAHDQFCWNLLVKAAHDASLALELRKRAVERIYRVDPDGANTELANLRKLRTKAMEAELDLRSSDAKRVESAIKVLWHTTIDKEKPRLVYLMKRKGVQEHLVKHLADVDAEARQILLSATFEAFPERFPAQLAPVVRAGLERPDLELKVRAAKAAVFLLRGDGLRPRDFRLVIDDTSLPLELRRRAIALLYKKHRDAAVPIIVRWIDRPVVLPTVAFEVLVGRKKPDKRTLERLARSISRTESYEEICHVVDLADKRQHRRTIRRLKGDARVLLDVVRAMRRVEAMMLKFGGSDVSTYVAHLNRSYRHERYGSQLLKRGLADRGDEELTQAGLYLSKARQLEPKIWQRLSKARRKFKALLKRLAKSSDRLSSATLKKRVRNWQNDRFFKSARFLSKLQSS